MSQPALSFTETGHIDPDAQSAMWWHPGTLLSTIIHGSGWDGWGTPRRTAGSGAITHTRHGIEWEHREASGLASWVDVKAHFDALPPERRQAVQDAWDATVAENLRHAYEQARLKDELNAAVRACLPDAEGKA